MSTVRCGKQAVLVVVDVQVGVMAGAWDAPRVVHNIVLAIGRARRAGLPVVWVQHEGDDLARGSAAWQLHAGLVPLPGEARVYKRFQSSFEATDLEAVLSGAGATHIVLAGAASNWCIRATAYAALDRGYDLTLLKDAHTTEDIALDDGARIKAADIVADLNLTLRWIAYPGRSSCAASVADADALAPGGAAG